MIYRYLGFQSCLMLLTQVQHEVIVVDDGITRRVLCATLKILSIVNL